MRITKKMHMTTIKVDEREWVSFARNLPFGTSRNDKIRQWIEEFNNYKQGKTTKIDKQVIEMKVNKLQDELDEKNRKMDDYRTQLQELEKEQQKVEEERLEKEKKQIEKLNSCRNCGRILNPEMKFHDFPIGVICHSCFMGGSKESMKKWNKQEAI